MPSPKPPSDDEVRDFLKRMPRGDRDRLAKAVSRSFEVEQRITEEYSAFTASTEKRLGVTVRRADSDVRKALSLMLRGDDDKTGMATFDSPDGKRVRVDGNTERRLAAARRRIEAVTRATMRGVARAGVDMQAEGKALAKSHGEALTEAERRANTLTAVQDRLDEIREALKGDDTAEIDDAEWQAEQAPEEDADIEETYQDDIAKLGSLYLDSARGRIANWRNSPRVEQARNQINSTGLHRGSVSNTVAGSARAAYRRGSYAEGVKRGATHAERRNVK